MPKYTVTVERKSTKAVKLFFVEWTTVFDSKEQAYRSAVNACTIEGKFAVQIRGRRTWRYEVVVKLKTPKSQTIEVTEIKL